MRVLLVIFSLVILQALTEDESRTENAHKEVPPPEKNIATEQPPQIDKENTVNEEIVPEKPSGEMISYAELEKLAKAGRHFMVTVVAADGEMSRDQLKKLPDISKEFAQFNDALKIYSMDARDPKNEKLAEQRIKVVPCTILFLGNADGIIHHDVFAAPLLLQFYQRVLTTAIRKIETCEALSAFEQSAYSTVFFVISNEFEETSDILLFARRFLDVKFAYIMKESDIAKDFPAYMYVHRKDGNRIPLEQKMCRELIEDFIRMQTHPPVFNYPADAYLLSTFNEDAHVFYANNLLGISQNKEWLQNIGNALRGKFVVLLCNIDDSELDYAMDYLALKRDGLPYVRIFLRSNNSLYKMEDSFTGEINKDSLIAFLTAFKEGKLKPYIRAPEPPAGLDTAAEVDAAPLKTLVTANYTKVVQNDAKNVLVFLHTTENQHVVSLIEKIAEICEGIESILVAKMDLQQNAFPPNFLPIEKTPSLRMYQARTNAEAIYPDDVLTEQGILKFIEQFAGIIIDHQDLPTESAAKTEPGTVDNAPKTEPVVMENVAKIEPGITENLPKTEPRIVENVPRTEPPVVENASKPEERIVESVPRAEPRVVGNVPQTGSRIVESAPKIEPSVVEAAPQAEPRVVENVPQTGPRTVETAPKIEPRIVETAPKVEPRVLENVSQTGPRTVENAPKAEPRVVENVPQTGPRTVENAPPQTKPRVVENVPQTGPRVVGNVPQTGPRTVETAPKTEPRVVENVPQTGPRVVGNVPQTGPRTVETAPKTEPRVVENVPQTGPRTVENAPPQTEPRVVENVPQTGPRTVENVPQTEPRIVESAPKPEQWIAQYAAKAGAGITENESESHKEL
ncbi:hypothetical protein V3C99_010191 [Haemonchus contortus]